MLGHLNVVLGVEHPYMSLPFSFNESQFIPSFL